MANALYISYYQIAIVFVQSSCFAIEKHWLPDLEWQTASNWLDNRLPDIDSGVVFPLETRHAVGIAKNSDLKLSHLHLPRSGSLALSRDGKLELSEKKTSTKVSKWRMEGHFFWADPENWNGSSQAAPHFERVPCRQDDVVLPATSRTFSMLLPIRDVKVRTIRMANLKHPFTNWQWDEQQRRREFDNGRFTVRYSEYSCEGCHCEENERGDYLEEICAIERARCGIPACEYPFKVEGHCCQYCGGRISISGKASMLQVGTIVDEAMLRYEEKVNWYVRRTWSGNTEVLLKEKGTYSGIDIVEAVESVKARLLDMSMDVLSSETAGAAMKDSRLAVMLGPLFGAPLIVLLFLLLGFLYFGYTLRHVLSGCRDAFSSIRDGIQADKAHTGKPFGFARFENVLEGNVQIAEEPSTREEILKSTETVEGTSSGGRFENPLYKSKRKKEEEKEIIDMDSPMSLSTLKEKVNREPIEEVEMNIDQ